MDREFLEKLLSYETSDEEREMLCEVAYGRPFSECLGEIRHDDFTLGLESNKYRIPGKIPKHKRTKIKQPDEEPSHRPSPRNPQLGFGQIICLLAFSESFIFFNSY